VRKNEKRDETAAARRGRVPFLPEGRNRGRKFMIKIIDFEIGKKIRKKAEK
jgi:hypothetical protein